MPSAIKPLYNGGTSLATPNALTITLASLGSATGGTGARQSAVVDNTTTRYARIHLYPRIKLGTSPTAGRLIYFFLIKDDGSTTPNRTDGAGAGDAALTPLNAEVIGTAYTTNATGAVIQPHFTIENPGPKWAIAVGQDTGVILDATGGNHSITWVGEQPEVA
jgi:hypothetical protein